MGRNVTRRKDEPEPEPTVNIEWTASQARAIYGLLDRITFTGPTGKKVAAEIQQTIVDAGIKVDEDV